MARVLVIEDAAEFQKLISRSLNHCEVSCVGSAEEALRSLSMHTPHLIILDIHLPGRDGYSFLTDLRSHSEFKNLPVICLTGRTNVADKIAAFSLGADDYVVKPFDPLELRARVDSKLVRHSFAQELIDVVKIGNLEIDHGRHRVFVTSKNARNEIDLTQTEFKLLAHLTKKIERVYTRDQLLIAVWGEDAKVLDRAVDTHICGLRRKLGEIGKSIRAVPSVGYKFVPIETKRQAAKL